MPTLLWKLLEEIRPGDHVVLQRVPAEEIGTRSLHEVQAAFLAGAFVSEGFVSERRAGFNNIDPEFFRSVVAAYDAAVGGPRYVSSRVIASGSLLHELDIQAMAALRSSVLGGHDRPAQRRQTGA